MADPKVFVVTGGNRGLGLETVRVLSKEPGALVYLTARSIDSGNDAAAQLGSPSSVRVLPLDVASTESIQAFVAALRQELGENSVDVLLNNAGAVVKGEDRATLVGTIRLNYTGTRQVTEQMLPLLKKGTPGVAGSGARVVNVASRAGMYVELDESVKTVLRDPRSFDAVDKLTEDFIADAVPNETITWGGLQKTSSAGAPAAMVFYSVSKMAMGAMTKLFAREWLLAYGITVSQLCPGMVLTDGLKTASELQPGIEEGFEKALGLTPVSVEEGAKTQLWLALAPESEVSQNGKFFAEQKEIDYETCQYL